ncbi:MULTISPECIES: flavin reductase family protein [Pseudooceanicola]|uniref:flavin reductase family protein n=1 Tax=Pseudooceanicola TaxID=1679449 RepID=UPI0035197126
MPGEINDFSGDTRGLTQTFRDAMASLAATACVVTAARDGMRLGRTVTAAFSLAVEPPSILVSIREESALAAMIRRAGGFSFAMLTVPQQPVAEAFAGQLPPEERFRRGDWTAWPSGHPRLHGAVATMDCAVGGEIPVAGHVLFVGEVRVLEFDRARAPLIWHDRGFRTVRRL